MLDNKDLILCCNRLTLSPLVPNSVCERLYKYVRAGARYIVFSYLAPRTSYLDNNTEIFLEKG